jgi:hypothetical protein
LFGDLRIQQPWELPESFSPFTPSPLYSPLMAWEPNCVAVRPESWPRKLPIGVLAAETM